MATCKKHFSLESLRISLAPADRNRHYGSRLNRIGQNF